MSDKYSRTNFYLKNNIDGIIENDLISNSINRFNFNRDQYYYNVKLEDEQRPDLISVKNFRRNNYWWLIMKLNDIEDIWNDYKSGDSLVIPNIIDMEEYYSQFRELNG